MKASATQNLVTSIFFKVILICITGIFLSLSSLSQDLDVTFDVSSFSGGNNVSCNSGNDGWIHSTITGGQPPYYYSWSNGSYSKNLSNLTAGTYIITVYDSLNSTISDTVVLIEAGAMSFNFDPWVYYGGYNEPSQGASEGRVHINTSGGSTPYTYLWSTSAEEDHIQEVPAGTYTMTLTDANGCSTTNSITLTEPTPIHITSISSPTHHGYNVSCQGGEDGAINITVAGGVPTYRYQWSSGSFDEDIDSLEAGSYTVSVTDANGATTTASISLSQPAEISTEFVPLVYPNGLNMSCHDCANGSIATHVTGGVSPYTYVWATGQTTATIWNQPLRDVYMVTVTDANGCSRSPSTTLNAPERDDWSMDGNANVNDSTHFFGTTNNQSLVIKTNDTTRMVIRGNGAIGIASDTVPTGYRLAVNGKIICEEVKVKLHTAWPDYVFGKGYRLMSLAELKAFINDNNHLPGIPDAKQMEQSGNDLGDMQAKLLQKIEENTLYLIQQNEKIKELEEQNKLLTKKLNELINHVQN